MSTSRGSGEPLADLEATLVEVEQVPKVQRIERDASRRTKVAIIVFAIFSLVAIAVSAWNSGWIADTRAQQVVNEKAIEDLREVNRLREEQGLPQIPFPEPGEPVDVNAVAEAAAAIALDQVRNDPRFKGPQGAQGEPCTPQIPGCTGTPGSVGPGGPQGQEGASGEQGPQGEKGEMGQPCSPDILACRGPQGEPGPPGPDCPAGFTGQFRDAPLPYVGETWFVCTDSQEGN